MAESGCYPKLDFNQLKVLSSDSKQNKGVSLEDGSVKVTETCCSPTQVVSLHSTDEGMSPPSPLFAPSPNTEQTERGNSFPDTFSFSATYSACVSSQLEDPFNELKAFPDS